MDEAILINEIKIFIQLANKGKQLAKISLGFPRYKLKIGGFRLLQSNYQNDEGDYLWIVPPTFADKEGLRHMPVFFERENWKLLEKKIFTQYKLLKPKNEAAAVENLTDKEIDEIFRKTS